MRCIEWEEKNSNIEIRINICRRATDLLRFAHPEHLKGSFGLDDAPLVDSDAPANAKNVRCVDLAHRLLGLVA